MQPHDWSLPTPRGVTGASDPRAGVSKNGEPYAQQHAPLPAKALSLPPAPAVVRSGVRARMPPPSLVASTLHAPHAQMVTPTQGSAGAAQQQLVGGGAEHAAAVDGANSGHGSTMATAAAGGGGFGSDEHTSSSYSALLWPIACVALTLGLLYRARTHLQRMAPARVKAHRLPTSEEAALDASHDGRQRVSAHAAESDDEYGEDGQSSISGPSSAARLQPARPTASTGLFADEKDDDYPPLAVGRASNYGPRTSLVLDDVAMVSGKDGGPARQQATHVVVPLLPRPPVRETHANQKQVWLDDPSVSAATIRQKANAVWLRERAERASID